MLTAVDARHHALDSQERDPQAGQNLVLSIDANIQFMAEQALDKNMERTGAANGTVVVQDPHTGQILALAIRPTFNPNDFRHTDRSLLTNRAVSDVYEPGSTFKLVAYSAALNEKIITPDSMIPTLGGVINVAGRLVHDDRDAIIYESHHGNVLSAKEALWESSDVAAIDSRSAWAPTASINTFAPTASVSAPGIELPGETRGLVKPPSRWQPTTIGSIPMGQEIAVTPIQLVTMASTIANGGVYLPPHIVLESTDARKTDGTLKPLAFRPGEEMPDPLPPGAHRVITELTSAQMRQDDGGRGALRHRPARAAERLQRRGQNRHRAEDRSGDPHLFEDQIRGVVRGLRAGQRSRHDHRGGDGLADEGLALRHCGERAGLPRSGAADPRVPGRAARSGPEAG